MAGTVQGLIEFVLVKHIHKNPSIDLKKKAKIIASHFNDIKVFLSATEKDFASIKFIGGEVLGLSKRDVEFIREIQASGIIQSRLNAQQNLCKIATGLFIEKQRNMIANLTLEGLNCNPILISALKLQTPDELVKFYTYQAAGRSIVTSMGYLVQDLLLYSGENIFDASNEESGGGTKWDLVKQKTGEIRAWIEVKSGPNDLDKAQILHYKKEIEAIERKGEKAYIGETYGKRESKTITHSLYKQYLPDWETRTLIGTELWDFISDDPAYHEKLINLLTETAEAVLHKHSLVEVIDARVVELTKELQTKYKSVASFINTLW
jgi:hypothetical protein